MTHCLIRLSRAANRYITGETIMLCATAYQRNWLWFTLVVDFCFWWKHRNHCHICWRYERKLAMDLQEWEFDHSPNFTTNVCDHCGQKHITDASITKTVYIGQSREHTYIYCSTPCSHEHYLSLLRRELDA